MARRKKKSDIRIYLENEATRIGSGWRGVQIVKVGRKWVSLRETSTGLPFKLPKRMFESMTKVK